MSITSAIRWMRVYLEDRRAAPQGGDQRWSGRIEAQADFLMQAVGETPDITLSELRERLIGDSTKPPSGIR